MTNRTIYRFVFAGGGTGGHLYPALAVAQQIRQLKPESEILFIGAKNKIESRVVPEFGFDFRSIWISGFSRKLTLDNLLFLLKVLVSIIQSLAIIFRFKPRVTVGSGGYVSGPVVWSASVMGAKILLLEQNSYPGVTNRLLEKKANEIHLTFDESIKYFRGKSKLLVSGNPIRIDLKIGNKIGALKIFGLDDSKKTLLILGGSLGARSINDAVANSIEEFNSIGIQIIWQTGPLYFDQYKKYESKTIKVMPFIKDMSSAYSSGDLVIARSGATTIAEVACLGLPVIFVPSTNVAANHQYMNAKSISDLNAAILMEDAKMKTELVPKVKELIFNNARLEELRSRILSLAKPNAAEKIAQSAIKYAVMI